MPSLLLFSDSPYPSDRAKLENVYAGYIREYDYQVIWIMQPSTPQYDIQRAEWHGTPVYITRRRQWRGIRRHLELLREYLRLGRQVIEEHDPDIIQGRTGIPEGLAAWWLARRYGKPFVYQYITSKDHTRRFYFQNARFPLPLLAWSAYRLERAINGFIMSRADLIAATSQAMCDEWHERGVRTPCYAQTMGADTRLSPEQVVPVDAPPRTVLYFGAMAPQRKVSDLLDAFARVLQQVPDAHLLMVGNEQGSGLPEYAHQLGIAHAITFTGGVPRSEINRYIRAACCSVSFINPLPIYLTSSPTKALESLAMGVPVVGNDEIPFQRDLLNNSGGGYAIPYDITALAEAIVHLLQNPDDARARGQRGLDYVRAHYDYRVLTQTIVDEYEAMFARRGPG